MLSTKFISTPCEIALRWMHQKTFDDTPTLLHVMAWYRQATSNCLSQCGPRFMPPWPLQWRHNDHDSVSNHQPHGCLLNRLFRRRSKKTSKLRVTGLCVVNSPGTGEFSAQMASYAENVSIWWRHHGITRPTWVGVPQNDEASHIHPQYSIIR